MNPENEREVFDRASNAKAKLNALDADGDAVREIREDLEIIARRSDPARHPDYEGGDGTRPEF